MFGDLKTGLNILLGLATAGSITIIGLICWLSYESIAWVWAWIHILAK